MKHLLFVAVLAMFIPPYHNITEEIFLNEDGSGRYNVYTNEVPMLKQAIMTRLQADKDNSKNLEEKAEKEIWSFHPASFNQASNPLKKANKDVKEDKQKRDLLKNITNFTIGNKLKNSIDTGVMCKFNNLEELAQLMDLLRTDPLQSLQSIQLRETNVVFEISNNKFTKQTTTAKKNASLSSTKEGTLTTNLYLPNNAKKVKGTNFKNKKGRLVSFEYKLSEVLSGQANTDFEVKWKK